MRRSHLDGLPVRVIRGYEGDPTYSPASGYRYDGLFRVDECWHEQGKDGFRIWRFRLVALDAETAQPPIAEGEPEKPAAPGRIEATIQRIVRSTKVAEKVKHLHKYACQVCGMQLITLPVHTQRQHTSRRLEHHTTGPMFSRMFCAYVRTTTCASTLVPSTSTTRSKFASLVKGRRWVLSGSGGPTPQTATTSLITASTTPSKSTAPAHPDVSDMSSLPVWNLTKVVDKLPRTEPQPEPWGPR